MNSKGKLLTGVLIALALGGFVLGLSFAKSVAAQSQYGPFLPHSQPDGGSCVQDSDCEAGYCSNGACGPSAGVGGGGSGVQGPCLPQGSSCTGGSTACCYPFGCYAWSADNQTISGYTCQ